MSTKRSYQRICVKKISSESLKSKAIEKGEVGTTVGIDVAKEELVVIVRWPDGTYERPWKIENPTGIQEFIDLALMLRETCNSLTIGMESTGTYSEAVRYAMTQAGLEVHLISGKSVGDYKEIFDGVPSQHDGKDAAIIAELTHFQKGTPWPYKPASKNQQQMGFQIIRLDAYRTQANQWLGRIEAMLAKHWPELNAHLRLTAATLHNICTHYGSPAAVAACPSAGQQLRSWGRGQLAWTKIDTIIQSARETKGLPMGESEIQWLREITQQAMEALAKVKDAEKTLQKLAHKDKELHPYVEAVGAVTLAAIWSTVGDPRKYRSSKAFLKALGLNLKELSSGKRNGELAITKRGPSLARKYLYYWALRAIQKPQLKQWYRTFQRVGSAGANQPKSEHRKMKGLIAMMRKLCKSLWFVYQKQEPFLYSKVFPGKPLQVRATKRKRERTRQTN